MPLQAQKRIAPEITPDEITRLEEEYVLCMGCEDRVFFSDVKEGYCTRCHKTKNWRVRASDPYQQ